MANHIHNLQAKVNQLEAQLKAANEWKTEFLKHLESPKFQNKDGGERADWIATGDVVARLQNLEVV